MKFQKGILADIAKNPQTPAPPAPAKDALPVSSASQAPKTAVVGDVEKSRLFETREEFEGNSRNYLKVFAIVVGLLVAGAGAVFYLTLPKIGDPIRAQRGMEEAVREHFLTSEKRTATDVAVYQCEGFYWARVGVETRNDIPNPVYRIGTYSARVSQDAAGLWQITAAQPAFENAVPCS